MNPLTLGHVLEERATSVPDETAYVFLTDGSRAASEIRWSQLAEAACRWGAALQEHGAAGKPVLLALPSGIDFIVSLFGCWMAGAIAVPVSLPRHPRVRHRLEAVIADAAITTAIGTAATRLRLESDPGAAQAFSGIGWLDPNELHASTSRHLSAAAPLTPLALLQYTSGSTGSPRGVMVTHSNLLHNSAVIAQALAHRPGETLGGWLPLFHDMGLIGLVIQAAFSAMRCVLMSPERFVMRPWLWLRMLSDYRACTSPAPNFAYDLCVQRVTDEHLDGVDLGAWRNALNGSEPVRAATLARFAERFGRCGFRPEALFPCYGLAEATLLVTGPTRGSNPMAGAAPVTDAAARVGCGGVFGGMQLAIVDPTSCARLPEGAIGEIWLRGDSVASGYWHNAAATAETFAGTLAEDMSTTGSATTHRTAGWLRTGDLGYQANGQLYITGRLRELIILAGRNLFPPDLERTVGETDPLACAAAVAFSTDTSGSERLIVVTEIRRTMRNDSEAEPLRRRIRAALSAEHDVTPHEVILVASNSLPRTSSGKLRRLAAREAYLAGTLEHWEPSDARVTG